MRRRSSSLLAESASVCRLSCSIRSMRSSRCSFSSVLQWDESTLFELPSPLMNARTAFLLARAGPEAYPQFLPLESCSLPQFQSRLQLLEANGWVSW